MSDLTKSRFYQNLTASNTGIKAARASIVAQLVEGELSTELQTLKNRINSVNLSISRHEDLSATDTQSLTVASEDFDAKEWLNTYVELLEERRALNIDLEHYQTIQKRQFDESEETE